jgi:hypothetical protein
MFWTVIKKANAKAEVLDVPLVTQEVSMTIVDVLC